MTPPAENGEMGKYQLSCYIISCAEAGLSGTPPPLCFPFPYRKTEYAVNNINNNNNNNNNNEPMHKVACKALKTNKIRTLKNYGMCNR